MLPFGDDVIYDFNAGEGDTLDFSRVYDHFPGLSVSVRPTEDGDIVATFAQTDGTPVGSVTLHRIAYQPVGGVSDPDPPHLPPEEFTGPYPPYVPWEEFADPGTPYTPPEEFGEAHGNPVDSGNPGIPDFLLPWVNLHTESAEADAM